MAKMTPFSSIENGQNKYLGAGKTSILLEKAVRRFLEEGEDDLPGGNETLSDLVHHDDDHDDYNGHNKHDDHEDHNDHDELHEEHLDDDSKPWSQVIIASLLINLVTLIGLTVLTGKYLAKFFGCAGSDDGDGKKKESGWKFTSNIVPSFATGALLATCAFLMFPEAFFMISSHFSGTSGASEAGGHDDHDHLRFLGGDDVDGHEDHSDEIHTPVAWRFGISVLGGFLLQMAASSFLFPRYHESEVCEAWMDEAQRKELLAAKAAADAEAANSLLEEEKKKTSAGSDHSGESSVGDAPATLGEECENAGCDGKHHHCGDEEAAAVVVTTTDMKSDIAVKKESNINFSLAASILIGDFTHNFTDGVLVGTSFLLCGRQLAIAISVATVYHELAQELADFFLLTKHCNIRPCTALALNFACGLSVMLGAILIMVVDISSNATGCILALGSGVYIYVAAGECLPRALQTHETAFDKAVSLFSFICGVVPIGLVLLNHGHC